MLKDKVLVRLASNSEAEGHQLGMGTSVSLVIPVDWRPRSLAASVRSFEGLSCSHVNQGQRYRSYITYCQMLGVKP